MDGVDDVLLLIEYITRCLVDDPEAATVDPIRGQDEMVYRLTVAPQDHRKAGPHSSMHLAAAGMKLKRKHSLDTVA
jgi:hypothetical protein